MHFLRFKNSGSTSRYFEFDRLFTTQSSVRCLFEVHSHLPLKSRSKKGLLTVARLAEFEMILDHFSKRLIGYMVLIR